MKADHLIILVASILAALLLLLSPLSYGRNLSVPDPMLTPGETRKVTVEQLCTTSTKLVRNVPSSVSKQVYLAYGMKTKHSGICGGDGYCELDHDISLSLGGTNGAKNLFPMPYSGSCNAHDKDKLEFRLYKLMCAKKITLKTAQKAISGDWRPAYKKYVNEKGCK